MKVLFHSIVTSERHKEMGYCEDSDFGKVELVQLDTSEKELIVSYTKYGTDRIEYVEHEGWAYRSLDKKLAYLSQEEEKKWYAKQGKFSTKSALELALIYRARLDRSFSYAGSMRLLLIGRKLYQRYCKVEDLSVTVCGNTSFSHWISIDFESHGGKREYPLSKSMFKEVKKDRKQLWEDTKPDKHFSGRADRHSLFSYPKSVSWGEKYNK